MRLVTYCNDLKKQRFKKKKKKKKTEHEQMLIIMSKVNVNGKLETYNIRP